MADRQQVPRALLLRALRSLGMFLVALGVALFVPAGDIRWAKGWLFLLVFVLMMVLAVAYLWRTNPDIFVARSRFHPGTKRWDKVLLAILLPSFMALFIVAGFDARWHWSRMPLGLVILGYILLTAGFALSVWAERVNKFAEPGVRIQTERGQTVIDTGPYAFVRHPLYVGGLLMCFGIPLALGSFWAFVPAAIGTVAIVVRTVLEDRMLREELPGYKDYARRVPYRLFPGLW